MNFTTLLKRAAVYGAVTVAMLALDVDKKIKNALGQ